MDNSLDLGDQFLCNSKVIQTDSIITDKIEFLLLFFGAGWSPQSHTIASQIKEMMNHFNEEGTRLMEVVYVSNDENEDEYNKFYDTYFGINSSNTNGCALPYNDERILQLREQYGIDCVPVVIVFDRHLDIITMEGIGEIQNLHPDIARMVWIQMLKSRLE